MTNRRDVRFARLARVVSLLVAATAVAATLTGRFIRQPDESGEFRYGLASYEYRWRFGRIETATYVENIVRVRNWGTWPADMVKEAICDIEHVQASGRILGIIFVGGAVVGAALVVMLRDRWRTRLFILVGLCLLFLGGLRYFASSVPVFARRLSVGPVDLGLTESGQLLGVSWCAIIALSTLALIVGRR